MNSQIQFRTATEALSRFSAVLLEIGIHVPAIVLCVHDQTGKSVTTHTLCEKSPFGKQLEKVISSVLDGRGDMIDERDIDLKKPERKRQRCTNAPDITWPSSNN